MLNDELSEIDQIMALCQPPCDGTDCYFMDEWTLRPTAMRQKQRALYQREEATRRAGPQRPSSPGENEVEQFLVKRTDVLGFGTASR